jgi:hypothetical protein
MTEEERIENIKNFFLNEIIGSAESPNWWENEGYEVSLPVIKHFCKFFHEVAKEYFDMLDEEGVSLALKACETANPNRTPSKETFIETIKFDFGVAWLCYNTFFEDHLINSDGRRFNLIETYHIPHYVKTDNFDVELVYKFGDKYLMCTINEIRGYEKWEFVYPEEETIIAYKPVK